VRRILSGPQDSIEAVLKYYQDEVVPSLAAAIVAKDKMPVEILNEIRNSVTHLAAASTATESKSKAKELEAARRHMKRACLDGLKTSVYHSSKKSDDTLKAIARGLQLPQAIHDKTSELRKKRISISESEGRRNLDDAILAYAELANEYDEFYVALNKEYAGEAAVLRARGRNMENWKNWIFGGFVGVLLTKVVEWLLG
jgi:hypothetical protein